MYINNITTQIDPIFQQVLNFDIGSEELIDLHSPFSPFIIIVSKASTTHWNSR